MIAVGKEGRKFKRHKDDVKKCGWDNVHEWIQEWLRRITLGGEMFEQVEFGGIPQSQYEAEESEQLGGKSSTPRPEEDSIDEAPLRRSNRTRNIPSWHANYEVYV